MELSINEINELSAVELLERAYGKKLESKKTVLEYIEIVKFLRDPEVNPEKVQETYNLIYNSIDKMNDSVKPNTIMFLKYLINPCSFLGSLSLQIYPTEPLKHSLRTL